MYRYVFHIMCLCFVPIEQAFAQPYGDIERTNILCNTTEVYRHSDTVISENDLYNEVKWSKRAIRETFGNHDGIEIFQDLNGDGIPEFFIVNSGHCGSGGCFYRMGSIDLELRTAFMILDSEYYSAEKREILELRRNGWQVLRAKINLRRDEIDLKSPIGDQ